MYRRQCSIYPAMAVIKHVARCGRRVQSLRHILRSRRPHQPSGKVGHAGCKGAIPLERSGRVGQPGKVWTSTTRGPIARVGPPPALAYWPSVRCPGWHLLLESRNPGGLFHRQRRARHFVWIAPTRLQRAME
eukprot:366562-Chlamydomonas_euryale.AAC.17